MNENNIEAGDRIQLQIRIIVLGIMQERWDHVLLTEGTHVKLNKCERSMEDQNIGSTHSS